MSAIDRDFALLLRHLLETFEQRNGREMARIRSVVLEDLSSSKRSIGDSKRKDVEAIDADELRSQFASFEGRDDLARHLRERYQSKSEVESIARVLRLPVMKTDNMDALIDRIIDATLGYRLRSHAIRGERPDKD